MANNNPVTAFVRLVRSRSHENGEALHIATASGWYGVAIGILRQELDSMVRVIFLLSTKDRQLRANLVAASLSGQPWKIPTPSGKMKKVTDRDMVDRAATLHGWAASVYRFGCAFIHLSQFHDYATTDPVRALPQDERDDLLRYLRGYHHAPRNDDFSLDDVVPLLPAIFRKIASNLDLYLRELEDGHDLRE